MASPVVADTNTSAVTAATTSHTVNLPPNIAAGDLLIVVFGLNVAGSTISWPAEFTPITGFRTNNTGGDNEAIDAAYRWADGTEGATITVGTGTSSKSEHTAYRITGAENPATQPPETGTGATGSGANAADPPNVAVTGGSKDILAIASMATAGEVFTGGAAPTNYTNLLSANSGTAGAVGTNGMILTAQRQLTASSEDPGTFGHDSTLVWVAQTIIVHPAAGGTNATVVAQPAISGVGSAGHVVSGGATPIAQPAVAGSASPAASVSAGNLLASPPALAGVAAPPGAVSTGATPIAQPALAGAFSPPETVLATSPDAIIGDVPPTIGGVYSPPGVVAADNKRPVRETLGGVVSPAPSILTESFIAGQPALSGGVIPQPTVVAISGGIVDATIVAGPAVVGVAFPGAGTYDDVVQINPRPATSGILSPVPVVSVVDGGVLVDSPPAVAGSRLSTSGTQRTSRLAVGHGTSGVEFPGKGDYESVVQSREIPLLSGGLMLAPFVFTNQAPSVEPTVIAPPAIAACRVSVSATQRSSTFTLAHTSVGALIPGAAGGGHPVIPPGVVQDWETPAISREDLDDAVSVTVGGHARSRSAVGSARSGGSSGSATSKK